MIVDPKETRKRLIGQAEHLIDEADALESLIEFVPDEILSSSPIESEPSIKEFYALLALYDRHVYLPALEAIQKEENPAIREASDAEQLAGDAWNEMPFADILKTLRETRCELVRSLKALPPEGWTRVARMGERNLTVYDIVYGLVQHDGELLRSVAMRLYDIRALGFSPPDEGSQQQEAP